MDDFETMRVFDARDDLLEEPASFRLLHTSISNDVVEELITSVFEDEDDIRRC